MSSSCPLCGEAGFTALLKGTDRLFGTTDKTFQIVQCAACRLMRLHPPPLAAELPRYYPKTYWYAPQEAVPDRLAELWRGLVLRDHVAFARKALAQTPGQAMVLDIGCGGGLFLKMLGLPRNRILGLDNSPEAAAVAWQSNGVPAVCGDILNAPLRQRSFSLITMYHVLEHLAEPASYLNRVRELLVPGGRLVVQVPNADCWQFAIFGEDWNGLDIPRHLVNFRRRDLKKMLEQCEFEVMREKAFSWRDNPAGFATSLAPGLDPMGRRSRSTFESAFLKLLRDGVYFGLVLSAIPFTVVEAMCGAGSTIMVEARPK